MSSNGAERIVTVPNILSAVRLVGLVPLLWLAWRGDRSLFLGLLVFLTFTDWIDGKLAVALDQQTEWGARLDSAADALMYAAIALSFWWLVPEVILEHRWWLVATFGTWALSACVGLARFGRLPSYHTRAAKAGWLVVSAVAIYAVWTGDGGGVPWALALIVLTNLEAVAIGLVLPEWRANVPTLATALRIRRHAAS